MSDMTEEMPKEIYLLTNKDLQDDSESKTIWSPDDDCEEIFEGYKIDAKYIRADRAPDNFVMVPREFKPTHKHLKRGTNYQVFDEMVTLQIDDALWDGAQFILYQGEDGKYWCRPAHEFYDENRFQEIAAAPQTTLYPYPQPKDTNSEVCIEGLREAIEYYEYVFPDQMKLEKNLGKVIKAAKAYLEQEQVE